MWRLMVAVLCGAACAQQPDPKLLENLSWRFIGPAVMGGRATDVEGVPGNPNLVYAATGGSGLFKTTNGGITWTPIFERENTFSAGDIALDPRNPEVIWVGTGEANMRNSVSFGDGVYKSLDGGRTWKHLGLQETEHIARVLLNPHNPEIAYVCAIGHQSGPNPERGVFLTTDGGKSWEKTLFVDDRHGCADMDIDPVNPNIVYAAIWRFERKPWTHTSGSEQGGVFQSTDGGRTWKKLTEGLPKLLGRVGVKVAPSDPRIVYVIAESKEGTLYRSSNRGEKFEEMTRERDVVSRGFYYADLRVDPQDPDRVYAIATYLQVSTDGGRKFRRISRGTHVDYHALWIDPTNPNRMWQGQDGGFAVSYDRGETWEAVLNLPIGQFYQIHADNRLPFYHITGGLQDNGTWTGPSRTRGGGIGAGEWRMVSFGDGFHALANPGRPDEILTESQGGNILITNMRTSEQQSVTPQPRRGFVKDLKYRFSWNTPIVGSPHGQSTVYFGGNVLFQSRNFGRSFEPISPDLTRNNPEKLKPAGGPVWFDNSTAENNGTIISIGESPVKAGVIWAGTDDGNLQVTFDNGKSWTNTVSNIRDLPAESPVSHVEPSRVSAGTAYASFDRHLLDDYRPLIYKTTDGGKTWTSISGNLPAKAYVHIVREDPKNPRLLYAGTELGLFASWTGGENWSRLHLKDLPHVAVHDILIHPRENDLILGTHGRSIVIFDDATPLQTLTPAAAEEDLHVFDVRPALRHNTGLVWPMTDDKTFVGKNPPYGALITYSLKDKVDDKADFRMEILDSTGAVIRSLKNFPRARGLNRTHWDLRYEPPKVRVEPTEAERQFGGGPMGPLVLPGTYRLRVTLGGKAVEKPIEVRLDPTLEISPEDLKTQLKHGLRLREMTSTLHVALLRMDSLKEQLAGLEKQSKAAEAAEAKQTAALIQAASKQIDEKIRRLGMPLKANRLEDEPGFAEDVVGLYGAILRPNAAPTPAQLAYFAELERDFPARLKEVNAFFAKSVPEWNEALRKLGLGGLSDWKEVKLP